MRRSNKITRIGMIVAASLLAATAIAQTGTYKNTNTDTPIPVTGTVTSIDSAGKTVTVDTPSGVVVYRTDNNSSFMSNGRTIYLADLRTSDKVTLYTTGTGDTMMLSRLEVMPAGSPTNQYNTTSSNRDAVRATDNNTTGTTTTASNYDNRNLPRTASELPLVGFAGLAMLGAAFALRMVRNGFFIRPL